MTATTLKLSTIRQLTNVLADANELMRTAAVLNAAANDNVHGSDSLRTIASNYLADAHAEHEIIRLVLNTVFPGTTHADARIRIAMFLIYLVQRAPFRAPANRFRTTYLQWDCHSWSIGTSPVQLIDDTPEWTPQPVA